MAYKKTTWVNDKTPLNADNMNNIENGIAKNEEDIGNKLDKGTEAGPDVKQVVHNSVQIKKSLDIDGDAAYFADRSWRIIQANSNAFEFQKKTADDAFVTALEIKVNDDGYYSASLHGTPLTTKTDLIDLKMDLSTIYSRAKYQHTVILSGEGFELCFTAKSSNNLVIDSYKDLQTVFGGERIGLTGYSAALSARPVYIDLNGWSESNDFIRVYSEGGGGFSIYSLASIGAITYSDNVCVPK